MEYSCARMIRSPFHDLLLGSSHLTSTSEKYKPFSIIHGRRGPGDGMGPPKGIHHGGRLSWAWSYSCRSCDPVKDGAMQTPAPRLMLLAQTTVLLGMPLLAI